MDKSEFEQSRTGTLVPTVDSQWAFVPHPLPPSVELSAVATEIAAASQAVGELNGISRTIENPYLLIVPLQAQEALTSSSMEGTYTTLDDLMLFEAGVEEEGRTAPDTREVRNYVAALRQAIDSLNHLPLCLRTLREAHAILLSGLKHDRGGSAQPGEFRDGQNWIGARSIANARFIPPPPRETREALHALERYIQRDTNTDLPHLVDAALVHYQFETIHPFADGNGRVGRILIPILLHERGVLRAPLLYLSPFFEMNRDEYIDRLFEVSRSGDWLSWVRFFLRGVAEAAAATTATMDRLLGLRADYRARLQKAGRSALPLAIVDRLFSRPVFSLPAIAQHLGVTYRAAQTNVTTLIRSGIVEPIEGTSHPRYYAARELMRAIDEKPPHARSAA
jgi:Fic family protein